MARGELRCQRSSRSGARSRLFGAASVAAIGVVTLCACGADRDASTSPSDAPTTLFGTPWTLTALTVEGTSIPLPDRAVTWVFAEHGTCSRTPCDDGPHLVGSDGCNSFERAIEFAADGTTVTLGEERWHADLFACQGPFLDAMSSLLRSESFRHTILSDQLLVTVDENRARVHHPAWHRRLGPTIADARRDRGRTSGSSPGQGSCVADASQGGCA